jgi:hypothetical protein
VLSTGAVAWSAALVAVACLAPVYSGESDTSRCTAGPASTATARAKPAPGVVVGWAAAIAITVFSLISFGMGTLTLPMAVPMIVAAARTPRPGATPTT